MISQTLSSIITNLSNAYDAMSSMGATIPASRNFENLASTIQTIQTGGGEDSSPALIDGTLTEYIDTAGSVSVIRMYGFLDCSNLINVSFPECTVINSEAFQNCSKLRTANFPKCTTIRQQAFYSCKSLSQIYCPNVTSIDIYAFSTTGLLDVTMSKLSA